MLEDLESVPWTSLPQPSWNRPTTVSDAIRRLALSMTEDDARCAYDAYLYAVGNNHAGTYFPVVLWTLPFLEEILRSPNGRAQEVTLDVLVDVLGSFEPDPDHRFVTSESGSEVGLQNLVREGVARFSEVIDTLNRNAAPASRTRQLAGEVLEILANAQ